MRLFRFAIGKFAALSLALTVSACSAEALPGEQAEEQAAEASELEIAGVCAPGTTLKGVDVSWYNGDVDWAKVKASGRTFAFARVSDGITQVDVKFARNWTGMKQAGLVRGVYQFFRARRDGVDQADVLLDEVVANGGFKKGDLPPVLDLETEDGQPRQVMIDRAKAWLARIEAKTGLKPIVYTGNHMAASIGSHFKDYPLWIAHYEVDCPRIPSAWTKWAIWQNSEHGNVPGITEGRTDTDFFNGTRAKLDAMTFTSDLELELSGWRPNTFPLEDGPGAVMGDGIRGDE